jgi:hypothetical protein
MVHAKEGTKPRAMIWFSLAVFINFPGSLTLVVDALAVDSIEIDSSGNFEASHSQGNGKRRLARSHRHPNPGHASVVPVEINSAGNVEASYSSQESGKKHLVRSHRQHKPETGSAIRRHADIMPEILADMYASGFKLSEIDDTSIANSMDVLAKLMQKAYRTGNGGGDTDGSDKGDSMIELEDTISAGGCPHPCSDSQSVSVENSVLYNSAFISRAPPMDIMCPLAINWIVSSAGSDTCESIKPFFQSCCCTPHDSTGPNSFSIAGRGEVKCLKPQDEDDAAETVDPPPVADDPDTGCGPVCGEADIRLDSAVLFKQPGEQPMDYACGAAVLYYETVRATEDCTEEYKSFVQTCCCKSGASDGNEIWKVSSNDGKTTTCLIPVLGSEEEHQASSGPCSTDKKLSLLVNVPGLGFDRPRCPEKFRFHIGASGKYFCAITSKNDEEREELNQFKADIKAYDTGAKPLKAALQTKSTCKSYEECREFCNGCQPGQGACEAMTEPPNRFSWEQKYGRCYCIACKPIGSQDDSKCVDEEVQGNTKEKFFSGPLECTLPKEIVIPTVTSYYCDRMKARNLR